MVILVTRLKHTRACPFEDYSLLFTLRKVNQNYFESFKMWCWRKMGKISWTQYVQNEVLRRMNGERNILHTIKRRKTNWTGHILRRNCLSKHVIEGKRRKD
jgi:hypothetical protein